MTWDASGLDLWRSESGLPCKRFPPPPIPCVYVWAREKKTDGISLFFLDSTELSENLTLNYFGQVYGKSAPDVLISSDKAHDRQASLGPSSVQNAFANQVVDSLILLGGGGGGREFAHLTP